MQGLERQVDTLSPLVRVPFYDDTITRIKADALLYDEDSFSWFQAEETPLTLALALTLTLTLTLTPTPTLILTLT